MRPPLPTLPIFERFIPSAGEQDDPRRRLDLLTAVFVVLAALLFEVLLCLTAFFWHAVLLGYEHLILTGLTALALWLFPRWYRKIPYTIGLVAVAYLSSCLSFSMGLASASLLWHLMLPTGVLLLAGRTAGWIALGFDVVVAMAQASGWLGPLTLLRTTPEHPWLLLLIEFCAALLFLLVWIFLHVVHGMLHQAKNEADKVRGRLETATESEARWADQVRFLEALMDLIPFPLFHKNLDGAYIRANASFRVVFDVSPEQVEGQKSESFLSKANAQTLTKIELDVYARDSLAVEETKLTHADGREHDFVVYLMPFVDPKGEPRGSIGVLIDITDRKQREQRYVELNETKDQLFSIISHDLRGPVGKIKQLLDIYIDDPSIFDKATWDQVFHDMRRSTDSLFQLLENLLSWARAQRSEVEVRFEAIPVGPIVQDVFSVLKLVATEKNISLESELNLAGPLMTDRHVFSTILRNLVHNALKFTPVGGRITVRAEETLDEVLIEVRDTGVGMAPEVIEMIFRKRQSVTTYGTAKERGQGLGLGLCLDLATVIGGNLTVESVLGTGTSFRLRLPTPEL